MGAAGSAKLSSAIEQGKSQEVEELLVNASSEEKRRLLLEQDEHGKTLLHMAATCGHSSVVEQLLAACSMDEERALLLNTLAKNGETPLHMASKCGHLSVVKSLLAAGCLLESVAHGRHCKTAIHVASRAGHLEVVKHLLAANSSEEGQGRLSALHEASLGGHLAIVKHLLSTTGGQEERSRLLEAANEDGNTALHLASGTGSLDVIQELLVAASGAEEAYRLLQMKNNNHVTATRLAEMAAQQAEMAAQQAAEMAERGKMIVGEAVPVHRRDVVNWVICSRIHQRHKDVAICLRNAETVEAIRAAEIAQLRQEKEAAEKRAQEETKKVAEHIAQEEGRKAEIEALRKEKEVAEKRAQEEAKKVQQLHLALQVGRLHFSSLKDVTDIEYRPIAKLISDFLPTKGPKEYLFDCMQIEQLNKNCGPFLSDLLDEAQKVTDERIAAGILTKHNQLDQKCLFAIVVFTLELRVLKPQQAKAENEFYRNYNEVLRLRQINAVEHLYGYTHYLIKGLQHMPPYSGMLWRGIPEEEKDEVGEKYKPEGRPIRWNGFSSASSTRRVAEDFAGPSGLVFRLEVNADYAWTIEDASALPGEAEKVILPNAAFRVEKTIHQVADGRWEIHLKQSEATLVF